MRNIVLVICTLCLVTTTQLSAQSIPTTQQITGQVVQQAIATPVQQVIESTVQAQTSYKPIVSTTAEPAVYEQANYAQEAVYETYEPQQQYYYQNNNYQRSYRRPVRQANYSSIPITQRPNRPGHVYGNAVRFLYRLGR